MKKESKETPITKGDLLEYLNYTSSAIEPKESPTEISDKISKMMPDMGIIRATGIIKKTDSFKESKQILTTFKESLSKSPEGSFESNKPNYFHEEPDNRSALERSVDSLQTVVQNMLKAGIEIPPIYKDFLHAIRPTKSPQELEVVNQPPLFKITGIDENGEVIVKTDTPIVLKKGKTEIALTHEKLTDTVVNSQKVDCRSFRELHNWVKQNVHRAGSLKKISDDEWNKLRQSIIESYNKHIDLGSNDFVEEEVKPKVREEQTVKIEVPPNVNKNAYELRSDILKHAIDSVNKINSSTNLENFVENVLRTANKFYDFVENKNRNNK